MAKTKDKADKGKPEKGKARRLLKRARMLKKARALGLQVDKTPDKALKKKLKRAAKRQRQLQAEEAKAAKKTQAGANRLAGDEADTAPPAKRVKASSTASAQQTTAVASVESPGAKIETKKNKKKQQQQSGTEQEPGVEVVTAKDVPGHVPDAAPAASNSVPAKSEKKKTKKNRKEKQSGTEQEPSAEVPDAAPAASDSVPAKSEKKKTKKNRTEKEQQQPQQHDLAAKPLSTAGGAGQETSLAGQMVKPGAFRSLGEDSRPAGKERHTAGTDWTAAEFQDSSQKAKFLRLMGMGKGLPDTGKDSGAGPAQKRQVNVNQGTKINLELEKQFTTAIRQHGKGRLAFNV